MKSNNNMKGVFLGFQNKNRAMTYDKDVHVLTIAQSGAGKNTCLIMPNLLMDIFPGSKIILDLKGENAAVCSSWRKKAGKGEAHILNPWGIFGMETIKFNPFCSLDAYSPTLYGDCMEFANAIYEPKENQSDTGEHFDVLARDFITSFLMYLTIKNYPDPPTPVDLLDEFVKRTISITALKQFVDEILDLPHPDEDTKRALYHSAMAMLKLTSGGSNGEFRGVCTTFTKAMQSFRGNILAKSVRATKEESLDLFDKLFQGKGGSGNQDLYISFPQNKMGQAQTWLRLVLTAFMRDNMARPPKTPVLYLLDEFPQLGKFNIIVKNAAYLRGFHVRFWFIAQNIGQLKANYGDAGKQTIMENCDVRQFFNVTDETAKYVSDKMGKDEDIIKDLGTLEYRSTRERDIMSRNEVEQCDDIINFIGNNKPFFTQKRPYFEIPQLENKALPNPLVFGEEHYKITKDTEWLMHKVNFLWGGMMAYRQHHQYKARFIKVLDNPKKHTEKEREMAQKALEKLTAKENEVSVICKRKGWRIPFEK